MTHRLNSEVSVPQRRGPAAALRNRNLGALSASPSRSASATWPGAVQPGVRPGVRPGVLGLGRPEKTGFITWVYARLV